MVKIVSLSDHAYSVLKRFKKDGMSFSDVIMRHFQDEEKTQDFSDMLNWVKSLPKSSGRKRRIDIDKIVYGVSRPSKK